MLPLGPAGLRRAYHNFSVKHRQHFCTRFTALFQVGSFKRQVPRLDQDRVGLPVAAIPEYRGIRHVPIHADQRSRGRGSSRSGRSRWLPAIFYVWWLAANRKQRRGQRDCLYEFFLEHNELL